MIFAFMAVSVNAATATLNPGTVLGTAGNFAIFSKAGITNVPTSVITGNIGTWYSNADTGVAFAGITCPQVTGSIYSRDSTGPLPCVLADSVLLTTITEVARADMETAYTAAAAEAAGTDTFLNVGAGTLGIPGTSEHFVPGVYTWGSAVTILNDIYLDGSSTDVWVFQISGTLDISSGKQIHLTGGALAKNIFWQVTGATTLGTTSVFEGNILDATNIAIQTGATLHGRALAQTAVTLDQSTVTIPEEEAPTTGPVFIDMNPTNGVLDSGEDFFDTIQAAIDAATSGDTIYVTAETYTEDLTIPAGKDNLILFGADKATTTIKGISNVPIASWPLAAPNIEILSNGVKIHGFTIEGPDYVANKYSSGIVIGAANVEIYNNNIVTTKADTLDEVSQAIQTYNKAAIPGVDLSGLNIHDNTFTGSGLEGYEGIYINPHAGTGTITINSNTFNGVFFSAVSIESSKVSITGNTINSNVVKGKYYGVRFIDAAGGQTYDNILIQSNNIQNVKYGISVGTGSNVGSSLTATIDSNTFSGNDYDIRVRHGSHMTITSATPLNFYTDAKIQDAINAANSGDTINVAAGTYTESLAINKGVTLQGAGRDVTTITGAQTITANDVTIDGFTLNGGITINDAANSISGGTISHNFITGAQYGIRIGSTATGFGVNNVTIDGNTITANTKRGILFYNRADYAAQGVSNVTISGNEITDNTDGGVNGGGISTYGPGPNTIINNIVSGNNGNGISIKYDDGDTISGNTVTGNAAMGINMHQVTNAVVENNVVSGHVSEVVVTTFWGGSITAGKGSAIYVHEASHDNTIRLNTLTDNKIGILINRESAGNDPSDNSINDNTITGNTVYGILNALVSPSTSTNAENNWWSSASGPTHTSNPSGTGDSVSDNVDYDPWCSDSTCAATADEASTVSFSSTWASTVKAALDWLFDRAEQDTDGVSIYLHQGWNTFKLPWFVLVGTDQNEVAAADLAGDYLVTNVLSSINGKYSYIAYYDGSSWNVYSPGYVEDDFTVFPHTATDADYDFHIYMTEGARLTIGVAE